MANNRHFGSAHSYFGADTKGHDLKVFGDTTGKYAEWDASADQWNIQGSMAQTGNQDITGTLSVSGDFKVHTDDFVVDVDGNITMVPTTGAVEITGQLDVSKTSTTAGGTFGVSADITQGAGVGLTGTLRGGYFTATNGNTAATGAIRGIEVKARAANSAGVGNTVALLQAGYFSADAKGKTATTLRGLEVSLDGEAAGSSTLAQGLVIFNNSSGTQTTSIGVDINGGTATGHKVFTYDIRLQYGATITNDGDGTVSFDMTNTAAGGASGLNAYVLQAAATGLTGSLRGAYIVVTNGTTTGTGTISGIEVKARAGTADATGANIATLRGAVISADVKTKTATTLRGLEISLDGSGGGSSTTAQGIVIFNNSSATQTSSYALDINGGTATGHKAFTADIRLQNGETIDNATDGTITFTATTLKTAAILDVDYVGTTTRAVDFQAVPPAGMTSGVDKQFMYVRADLDRGWDEDVSGGDGYTVGMFRGYIGANAGGMIAIGLRAGMNLDAGVIVSDGAGAGYISGAQITTYVPATANAKCNKGIIIAPRDDTAVAAIAGSQYIGAQLYLMQVTAKQESWGLDIYTESACADLNAAINIRNGGNEKYIYGIDMNGMSTPTADIRFSAAATILNSAAGALDVALGTIAGTTADNGLAVTVTDSTTFSSGYANALYLNLTNSGNKTGNFSVSQINGFAADITMAGTGNLNGGYIYIAKSGSPNLSTYDVIGWNVDIQEMGATNYLANLQLQKTNTTKGTGVDAFILCSLQLTGVAKSLIHVQGIAMPDNFLTIQPGSNRDMLVTGTPTGSTKRYLKVDLDGVAYGIEVNSVA